MSGDYDSVIMPVACFLHSLGRLPDGFYTNKNISDEEMSCIVIREDIRKINIFHPDIDPRLIEANLGLEEVIRYGMESHIIEFFEGIAGIRSERCYEQKKSLTDKELFDIETKVYEDYDHLFDEHAEEAARKKYERFLKESGPITDLAKRLTE